jgi:hypothetical protein
VAIEAAAMTRAFIGISFGELNEWNLRQIASVLRRAD